MKTIEEGEQIINDHVAELNKLKGTSKESTSSIDFSIEVLELLKKWGVGSLSITELDKWRDRLIWHVQLVNKGENRSK